MRTFEPERGAATPRWLAATAIVLAVVGFLFLWLKFPECDDACTRMAGAVLDSR